MELNTLARDWLDILIGPGGLLLVGFETLPAIG